MSKTSAPTDPWRLGDNVVPSHYALHLNLDPAHSSRFSGTVEIEVQLKAATREITLHAADLDIASATFSEGDLSTPATTRMLKKGDLLRVRTRSELNSGRHLLRLAFSGKLRTDLRGLYGVQNGECKYAFTQLQATDARRMFPCFDEPAFKATFGLAITTGAEQTVVSNAPEKSVEFGPPGSAGSAGSGRKKTVLFETTPKLSTYLIALAVGPLEVSETVLAGKVPMRIFHAPGAEQLTAFGLRVAADCLVRLQRYFGVPYPYGKLDLLAVPDFEIGAMENAGAVFFREPLLLVDETSASLPEKKRAAEVICHELAHMWFGNLVTMAWWDDLWLNEAFATWIAFAIVDEMQPDWHMWSDFCHGRNTALAMDALVHTHPVFTPVRNADEASENFDLITYEKGAAIVRMLDRHLGKRTFQAGVRAYIRKHAESNTVASDLWLALQRAAQRPGLAKLVQQWVSQPGFPLVHIEQTKTSRGRELRLHQETFRANGPARKPSSKSSWSIPLSLRVGTANGSKVQKAVLGARTLRIPLKSKPHFVYGNAEEGGFFRPLHSEEDLQQIAAHWPRLSAPERIGLISHAFAHAHAGYAPLSPYLNLLRSLGHEQDPEVLSAIAGPLSTIFAACISDAQREGLQRLCVATWGPALDDFGLNARPDEPEGARLARANLYTLVGYLGRSEKVVAHARTWVERYLKKPAALEANLARPVTMTAASDGDLALFERCLRASERSATPQQRRLFRLALAEFRTKASAQALHKLYEKPVIPTQDVALVLSRQLENPAVQTITWTHISSHWATLERRLTPMLASRLIWASAALPPALSKEVIAFYKAHPIPTAKRTLQQVNERFANSAAFQKRAQKALAQLHQ